MWRSLLALSCIAVLWTQPPTVPVTFAWDLHPSHEGATWEVEANGTIYPCLSVTVTATDRRCTATLPRTTTTFRVRGTNATGIGAWSAVITDVWTGPGPFVVRAHFEGSASVAITFLTQTAQQSANTTSVTTSAISSVGASLIVVAIASIDSQTEPTLSDSPGGGGSNTWAHLTARQLGLGSVRIRMHYVENPTTNASHTFTASSGVATYPAIAVMTFSNTLTASAFDVENGNAEASVTNSNTGNVTPTLDNELIISAVGSSGGTTTPSASGVTLGTGFPLVGGVAWGIRMGYGIQTTATTNGVLWTIAPTNANLCTAIATFKDSGTLAPSKFLRPNNLRPAIFSPGRAR